MKGKGEFDMATKLVLSLFILKEWSTNSKGDKKEDENKGREQGISFPTPSSFVIIKGIIKKSQFCRQSQMHGSQKR